MESQIYEGFVNEVLSPIYTLALAVSFIYFLYTAAMYIFQMNDEEKRTLARNHLLWGFIGLFIMFSIGALFNVVTRFFSGIIGF